MFKMPELIDRREETLKICIDEYGIEHAISDAGLDPEGTRYEVRDWDRHIIPMIQVLLRKIRQDGREINAALSVRRGGMFVGQACAGGLGIVTLDIGAEQYNREILPGKEAAKRVTKIYKGLSEEDLENLAKIEGLIIFDEVNHTGSTHEGITTYLKGHGVVGALFAVLDQKSALSSTRADYFVRDTINWILYPWEYGKGSQLHKSSEFPVERLPSLMIPGEGKPNAPFFTFLQWFYDIGFPKSSLPTLFDTDFHLRLSNALMERIGKVYPQSPFEELRREVLSLLH